MEVVNITKLVIELLASSHALRACGEVFFFNKKIFLF